MGQSTSLPTNALVAPAMPHPPAAAGTPPPECPMHAGNTAASKYVPTDDQPTARPTAPAAKPAQCPIDHESKSAKDAINPLNQMPLLSHEKAPNQVIDLPTNRTASTIPRPPASASLPSAASSSSAPLSDPSNPYNTSPNTDDTKVWEYPSPQQFYNALVRKGWETPEEHVETMVEIHNFLNEEAWDEVLGWEKKRRG
jgi:cytochrome c heme-lyase